MEFSINTKKTLPLISVLIIGLLLLGSCVGAGTSTRGWAGVSEINGTLIFASMTGNVYSVNGVTGEVLGDPIKMVVASSGGLGCIPTCSGQQTSPIAMYSSPGVSGDLVYFAGSDGKVYAYQIVDNRLRDQPRWIYPPQGTLGSAIVGGLTIADDKLYFSTTNGTVFSLTAAEGYKEWSYDIDKKIWSAPAVEGDTLYIGTFDKKVYALDIATGSMKWDYETGGAIIAMPLVNDGLVYVGSYDRHLYALDTNGNLVWKFPADDTAQNRPQNWFWVKPVLYNGFLYAPCLDGKIYIIDAKNGSYIDTISVGGAVSSVPVTIDDTLVVAASNLAKKTSRIYFVDMSERTVRELTSFDEGINAPLFANNGVVYIHTTGNKFYGLDVQNGAVQQFSLTTSK